MAYQTIIVEVEDHVGLRGQVFLGVEEHVFYARLILEADLVEALSLMGLGAPDRASCWPGSRPARRSQQVQIVVRPARRAHAAGITVAA